MGVENGGSVDTVTASNSAGINLRGGTLSNVVLTTSASMNVESGGSVSGVSVGDTADVAVDPNSQISSPSGHMKETSDHGAAPSSDP